MLVVGRNFTEDILTRIRSRVADDPTLTRTSLSREVCTWLGWHSADGRLKDMSCRVALLKLFRRGIIPLPASQDVSFAKLAAVSVSDPDWLTLNLKLLAASKGFPLAFKPFCRNPMAAF